MKKILITGGAGFIGANTAALYLKRGEKVTIFDNLSRPGVKHNLKWLEGTYSSRQLRIKVGDVCHFDAVREVSRGQDVIFHLAGQTAVTTSIEDPRYDFETNALGTFNILEAVRLINPAAVILYTSTNKVYGAMGRVNAARRGKRYYSIESANIDESEPLDFYSPYGCSKGTGDQYMLDYARIYGLKTIVFRQSCIYGPHQFGMEDQGWVAHFVSQAIKGEPVTIFGTGKQVRDMLYIADLLAAFDGAVRRSRITAGQAYNIGGGVNNSMSLLELIDYVGELTGRVMRVKFLAARSGDQKVFIANIAKARRDFGWRPKVHVKEGAKSLYFWLRDNTSTL